MDSTYASLRVLPAWPGPAIVVYPTPGRSRHTPLLIKSITQDLASMTGCACRIRDWSYQRRANHQKPRFTPSSYLLGTVASSYEVGDARLILAADFPFALPGACPLSVGIARRLADLWVGPTTTVPTVPTVRTFRVDTYTFRTSVNITANAIGIVDRSTDRNDRATKIQ